MFKLFFLFCAALIICGCFNPSNQGLKAIIKPEGKLYFFHQGLFKNELYPIKKIHNEWYWEAPDGDKQIAVPCESRFDDAGDILVLDKGGDIYIRSKDRTERNPLKVINGEWNKYQDGSWSEISFEVN